MRKPHKHAELIKQWADGSEIEVKYEGNEIWHIAKSPRWNAACEYRIKPEREYPTTSLTWDEVEEIFDTTPGLPDAFIAIANAAIRRYIEDTEGKKDE